VTPDVRMRALRALAAMLTMLGCTLTAFAQSYPAKSITAIVPYPAGGVVDIIARTLGQEIAESTGQPFVVVNKAGANSIIGMQACAAAAADGYTICLTIGDSVVSNPLLYANLPYDAENGFAPVTLIAWSTSMLVASEKAPIGSFKELVAYSKAHPGGINFGTWGPASAPDLYLRWIRRQLGIDITAIPYKGAGQANPALFASEIDATLFGVGNALPYLKAGKLKPLAVMGTKRSPLLPDVPSLGEEGVDPGLSIYFCAFAPAKTPRPVIERLQQEFVKAMRTPRGQQLFEKYTLRPEGYTPDEFARFLVEDRANTQRVFTALGIKPSTEPPQ
jgi:tripartite-type tricarboxylate transporter receptor subunit TctC